jgi:hypothetical protein
MALSDGEFEFRALAGIGDLAKVSCKRCCATCNSEQRRVNVCTPKKQYFHLPSVDNKDVRIV